MRGSTPVVLSLVCVVIAIAGVVRTRRGNHELGERLEAAVRELDRLDVVVSESTAHIEAWVRSQVAELNALQREATKRTFSEWSAGLIAEVEALFSTFRLTVKTDTAALVGKALAEYENRDPLGSDQGES